MTEKDDKRTQHHDLSSLAISSTASTRELRGGLVLHIIEHHTENIYSNDTSSDTTIYTVMIIISSSIRNACRVQPLVRRGLTTNPPSRLSTPKSPAVARSRMMSSSGKESMTTTPSSSSSSPSNDAGSYPSPPKNTTIVFPWRYEEIPLLRLVDGTIEHATQNLLFTSARMPPSNPTINALATAYMFLDVPWYELLWYSNFRDELAQSMSFAWTRGVACLLSDLSGISDDKIVKDTYGIDFHETISTSGPVVSIEDEEGSIPLTSIFEKKVIDLYQSASKRLRSQSIPDKDGNIIINDRSMEVRLKIVPYDTEFIGLYSIPYLSRENSVTDPHLLSAYKKMLQKPARDRAPDLNKLRRQYLDRGRMESTVIAQCLVWCREIFYVKDLSTGEILQGTYYGPSSDSGGEDYEQLPQIPHLVRMETTVITESDVITGALQNIQSDWIITDIDDLLGGNLVV